MKKILLTAAMRFAATGAEACGFIGQPPCYPGAPISSSAQPLQSMGPTMIQPFANGYIANTPGVPGPPTTIMPFSNGYMINTPGRRPTNCQRFGTGMM